MSYDVNDTIAAIASAAGGAARGVIRMSGPETLERLAKCFVPALPATTSLASLKRAQRIAGVINVPSSLSGGSIAVNGELLVWPNQQSYTRQPAAEFHMIGSPPLLTAVLEELERQGVRPAERGEFTLRAFVAGRIDLMQAEGVLGVIDAEGRADLDAALDQVAGGMSRPLHQIREDLLSLLAELEAGLDFVEEDIEFIGRDELAARIAAAQRVVTATQTQLGERDRRRELPRVVLLGPPNAGKSSLFNALIGRFGVNDDRAVSSIVSPTPGATRDYVVGCIRIDGVDVELIDTAGIECEHQTGISGESQRATSSQQRTANLRLRCIDAASGEAPHEVADNEIAVHTKCDLSVEPIASATSVNCTEIHCSSTTGAGLTELAAAIAARVALLASDGEAPGLATTATRCHSSLRRAAASLAVAHDLVMNGGDELLAAEIRHALDALGEIVGAICTDDVLDRVFSQFCIGK